MDNPYINNPTESISNTINDQINNFNTNDFLKGALIGAVATYLLTNEKAQKAIFKTVAKGTQMVQAGVEEMKERMEDAKAEMEANNS